MPYVYHLKIGSAYTLNMANYNDIYTLVRYVADENKKIYSTKSYQAVMDKMTKGAALVPMDKCVNYYMKLKNVDMPTARRVLDAAIKAGYIEHHSFGISINSLSVTPYEGENFLKILFCIKLGKWNDILKHYTSLPIVISSVSVLVAVGALVISILVAKHVIR